MWTEDLQWAHTLLKRKQHLTQETDKANKVQITELTEEDDNNQSLLPLNGKAGSLDTDLLHLESKTSRTLTDNKNTNNLKKVPANYVFMRD